VFELFPGNYRWSYNAWAALAAGGEFGDMSLILDRLRQSEGDDREWQEAWAWLAGRLERRAAENLATGTRRSACENFFLASLYHKTSEQFIPPADPARMQTYQSALRSFETARELSDLSIERVLVPYEGKALPAYFVPARRRGDAGAPTVIFICGLDTTKEITFLRIRSEFAERGFNLLAIDTPGVGEALRLGKIYTRHDYEVPVRASVDYLETRDDVDKSRICVIGSSLGGYYVGRAAAFEPRLAAAVAWGANFDYHAVWHRRITVGGAVAAPMFQLMYITGSDTMDAAMNAILDFRLAPVAGRIKCPFLILHGKEDQQISAADAEAMFAAVGSTDKTLKIFSGEDGGAAHCQFDNHFPALLFVSDWLTSKLNP
jgi:alpha-beta hydrolase superfamily lysophospholipase